MRVALCLFLLAAATACSNGEPAPVGAATTESGAQIETTGLFTVGVYDPDRDASADLTATIARATKEGKRILLEVGGLW